MPNSFGRPAWYSLLALTAAACEPQQGADAGNPGTSPTDDPGTSPTDDPGTSPTEATTSVTGEPTSGDDEPIKPPLDCERPVEWSVRFGGPTFDTVQALAVDPAGNIYVGLDLRNLGDSAPVSFGMFEVVPGDLSNIVVAKLTTDGEVAWVRQFGGPGDQFLWTLQYCGDGVVLHAQGDPGTVDLGGGPIAERVFLAALDGAGKLRWSHPVPTEDTDAWLLVTDMACDSAGNLVLTGSHHGVVDLGGGPSNANDGFIARLDTHGAHLWSRDLGDPESRGFGIAMTPSGDIVVTASFEGTVDLGGGPFDGTDGDILVATLDGAGKHVWSQAFGPSGYPQSLAIDSTGHIVVGGDFLDELVLGAQTYTNVFPNAEDEVDGTLYDGFLAALAPGGELEWSIHLGSKYEDAVYRLMFDSHDTLMMSGLANDAYILRTFVNGKPGWSWCSSKLNQVHAALSGDNAVIIAPWGADELDLGPGATPGFGDSDVVIAKVRR